MQRTIHAPERERLKLGRFSTRCRKDLSGPSPTALSGTRTLQVLELPGFDRSERLFYNS
jgi:hypothetical protein